jgi:cytochrome c551
MRNKAPDAAMTKTPGAKLQTKISSPVLYLLLCTLLALPQCSSPSGKEKTESSPKFTQYYNQGEQLYQQHCSNCHQKNGSGLGRLYPPLATSDFMDNHFDEAICLIRNGKSGPLTVNGINFNQPMPGIASLTDLEIAEITTYIYNTWNHKRGLIEVKTVTTTLHQCPPQNKP